MAILLKEYEDLEDVLIHIKKQIMDSLDFADSYLPNITNPETLFYWLKERIIYQNDPNTIELIMTMQTMMSGSRTGKPGAGDCDDFTITAMACLFTIGCDKNEIVLAGNSKSAPVHIYVQTFIDGDWKAFDLTNDYFNEQRKYKYKQFLPFVYSK